MTSENLEVKISFRYEYEDYKKAFLSVYNHSTAAIFLYIVSPILIISVICLSFFDDLTIDYNEIPFMAIVCGVSLIFIILPYIQLNVLKRKIHTTYKFYQIEHFVIINKDGLHWENEFWKSDSNWISLYKIIEQKENFCFNINSADYRILPKRILDSKQIELIRSIIIVCAQNKYHKQGIKLRD